MSRNGSGTYTLPAGNPVVTGTVISSTTQNNTLTDIATALTNSIAANGETPVTANLPMANHKLTGLAAGTTAGDSVRYEQAGTVAMVETHAATSKATPVDADELPIADSAATFGLKKLTWANLKATLKTYLDTLYLTVTGGNLTGSINGARGSITQNATTMDFFAITSPDVLDGTGSAVTITACVNAPQAGAVRIFYPLANTVLTHGATFDIAGNANLTAATGDAWIIEAKTTSTYKAYAIKKDGTPVVPTAFTSTNGIQPYNTNQTLTTAHKGKYIYIYGTGTVTLTLPAASTFAAGESLLLANSQQSGAGTTTVSRAGSDSIFAKGSGAVTSIVLGFGDSVWLVSNGVDQWIAVAEASHIGIGQAWQSVTRTHGTTYYNNTGKPIVLSIASTTGNGTHIITVGGVQVAMSTDVAGVGAPVSAIIPPNGTSYVVSGTGTETWTELR